MLAGSNAFNVLGHIDYPIRSWPGPFTPHAFEEELRAALSALAAADRAVEFNTRLPLDPSILRWCGQSLTFGSDAHLPEALATGLAEGATVAMAHGFEPSNSPTELWRVID